MLLTFQAHRLQARGTPFIRIGYVEKLLSSRRVRSAFRIATAKITLHEKRCKLVTHLGLRQMKASTMFQVPSHMTNRRDRDYLLRDSHG